MPLASPLRKWISDCKAYAAKHGCSYKQAMKALKRSRRNGQHGGGVADQAFSLEGFTQKQEGNQNIQPPAGDHSAQGAGAPTSPAGTHPLPTQAADTPPPQTGGQAMFEAGAVADKPLQQQQQGGKYRRRGKKGTRKGRSQSHSGGGKRRKNKSGSRRRRRNHSGGSSLSYSQY